MYGNGDIEISRALYNYVEDYLSSGIKISRKVPKAEVEEHI